MGGAGARNRFLLPLIREPFHKVCLRTSALSECGWKNLVMVGSDTKRKILEEKKTRKKLIKNEKNQKDKKEKRNVCRI